LLHLPLPSFNLKKPLSQQKQEKKNARMSKAMSKKMMNKVMSMKTMSVEHTTYLAYNLILA